MKYIIAVLLFFVCAGNCHAQVKATHRPPTAKHISKDTTVIFDEVEAEAEFAGGDTAWRSFLMNNLDIDKFSDSVKFAANKKVFRQTAIVKFIVCTDGSLCNITTENKKKVHPLIQAEVERVMKLSPNWIPAIQNGKPVKAYRRQPITVLIERE
jgi:periplasmic protein TonB